MLQVLTLACLFHTVSLFHMAELTGVPLLRSSKVSVRVRVVLCSV